MKETEKIPFDSMPQLIRGSFLTKEQVEKIKEPFKNLVFVVRCKDCEWYSPEISWCNNLMSPKEQTFFCADGKVQGITNRERIVLDECISNKGD